MKLRITLAAAFFVVAFTTPGGSTESGPIEKVLKTVRPRAAEQRWRLVPWHTSLSRAFAVAKKQGKPLFFFGYDGVLGSGNC